MIDALAKDAKPKKKAASKATKGKAKKK